MAFRLHADDPIGPRLAKIANQQLEIVAACHQAPHDAARIHNARKALKRLRALSLLLRTSKLEPASRRIDHAARDIGRLLSGRRDLDVLPATLAKLEARFGIAPERLTTEVHRAIEAARAAVVPETGPRPLDALLQSIRMELADLVHARLPIRPLVGAAAATLKRGRRQLRAASRVPDDERIHDLRKTIQRHWRHMALLSPAWPEYYGVRADLAKELSRTLGEHHDLAVLLAFMTLQKHNTAPLADRFALASLIRSRQEEIWGTAEPLVQRLMGEKPKTHAAGLRRNWRLGTRLATAPRDGASLRRTASRDQGQQKGIVHLAARNRPLNETSSEFGDNAPTTPLKPA
jgi:CHAD domain-containing protein